MEFSIQLGFLAVFVVVGSNKVVTKAQVCDHNARYRTLSGMCNNLQNPYFGSSPRTHNSILPPDYGDGKICPRAAQNSTSKLPLARVLSSNVMYSADKPNNPDGISELHIYYGMFLAHDMVLTYPTDDPTVKYPCPRDTEQCPITRMYTGPNDKFIKDTKCLEIAVNLGKFCDSTTSKDCGCPSCTPGQYQHKNFMTSFIDLSNVYGITEGKNQEIREPETAKFKVTENNLQPLAPSAGANETATPCIQADGNSTGPCLLSGEQIGNISPYLQGMNTLFVREHNRLVEKFRSIYPDEETLFQEVRKILIAITQHITYNEYLPSIFGKCMRNDLKVPTKDYQYDSNIDPTVTKEFVTGAFRFGHSQPMNFGSLGNLTGQIPLGQLYTLIPYVTSGPDVLEKMMEGLLRDEAVETDYKYNDQMINQFKFSNFPPLSDLAAIDIQRGRLHGIQPYVKFRKYFNLTVPKNFVDLNDIMPINVIYKLTKYYGLDGVQNLDLHLAALAEFKVKDCPGGMFGETYKYILEDQFAKLKFGDRYWFERSDQPWSFTPEQLKEIRKTTLSGLVCRNTKLTEAPFKGLVATSPTRKCKLLERETDLDEYYWKE